MITFRKQGPWSIQLYWPSIGYRLGSYYFDFPTRGRLQFRKGVAFGVEILGFGFGVMK